MLTLGLKIAQHSNPTRGLAFLCSYAPVAVLALGSLALSMSLQLAPKDPRLVTAIFSPFSTAETAFLAAAQSGTVVSVGPRSFMVTVAGDDDHLAQRLRAAGAIAVIDPNSPLICGQGTSRTDNGK